LAAEFDLSSATVRNELVALEAAGLITSPHTSSGRIPTEKGYRFFIQNMATAPDRPRVSMKSLRTPRLAPEEAVKILARTLAEETDDAVVVGFGPHDVYYTGLSRLFAQREFEELAQVIMFTELIDRMDQVMTKVFPRVSDEVQIWIGRENPFGASCSAIVVGFHLRDQHGVLGLLGPVRMDYERGVSLMAYAQEVLSKF